MHLHHLWGQGSAAVDFPVMHSELDKFAKQHPPSLGGPPVLAWRRQHRRSVRSVLPPLDRCSQDSQTLLQDHDRSVWSSALFPEPMQLKQSRHVLLPPGLASSEVPASPSCSLKMLPGSVKQGPPLRPLLSSISTKHTSEKGERDEQQQISAMALDLKIEEEEASQESAQDELLLPAAPEDSMAQHWFPIAALEAQVRQWRQQDLSAEGDDVDEQTFVALGPARVRPGEFLLLDPEIPDDDVIDLDVDVDEEDVATFATERAVDLGLHFFFTEADMEDFDWGEQEEV